MGWHPGGRPDPAQLGRLQRGDVRQHPGAGLADLSGARQTSGSSGLRLIRSFWRGEGPTRRLAFAPLVRPANTARSSSTSAASAMPLMREAGFDYFENSRRETYANRAYCIANPMGWEAIRSACGAWPPATGRETSVFLTRARQRQFFGYSARGPLGEPDGRDDGTLTPTAALGSLPFAPEIVIPAAEAMLAKQSAPLRATTASSTRSTRASNTPIAKSRDRVGRSATRLGRQRLSRHRPGTDPAAGRQLSRRFRLALHAAGSGNPARLEASRVYRRLARLISAPSRPG